MENPLQRSDCGWAGVPTPFPVVALPDNHNPREGTGSFGQVLTLTPYRGSWRTIRWAFGKGNVFDD